MRILSRILSAFAVAAITVGCGLFSPSEPAELSLLVLLQDDAPEVARFEVRYDDSRDRRTLDREAFRNTGDIAFNAGPFETPARGALEVSCMMFEADGHVISGDVTLPLRKDWRYRVDCIVGSANPFYSCFGCQGYRAWPFGPQAGDSLFVVWSGNSINHPVVY